GKPGAKGEPGKSVTPQEVVSALNTASFRGSIRDTLKADATFVAATKGDKGEQGVQGVQGKPGAKGEPGKSVTPQEVADVINTTDWQNQIASAAASNIIQTPTLSDKIREMVQPDTTELIKRLSSRTMSHDILSQNGGKYRIDVPAFALFNPAVEDGAAISLQVDIRQPIGSCTTPDNIDSRGYFFIVSSAEEVYTTSAEKLCGRGGEIKVYYDSYQCAESHLSIKLERANGHWIFVNYYDFSASIQADCTQIITRSYYSNNENAQELDYSPFQYLSGKKRDAFLPEGRVGLTIKVWANKWVGDVRVRSMIGESLYNTSASSFQDVGGAGVVVPAGHIGEFICINEEKIWLYTDLSR
ncbi:MAG: collagen-like triple helix repeat-containing protein, partial [Porphyromonas endodontalis]|uniref:collagen-like triple helix repeat-containing protein n=1 Tax=Porphyromonas endodontalis TaxID=28124 RepID=UPI003F9F685C